MCAFSGKVLESGKLPIGLLQRFLKRYTTKGRGVVVGASTGVDAAVIDPGPGYLLAKTDPITFVAEDIGTYAIHINANDIAVMGGSPRWFLAAILLPEGRTTAKSAEKVFKELHRACSELDISLCGGHTEITPGLDRTIVIGQMLGTVDKKRLVTPKGARPGDHIILTKGIAIEAASIIAREKSDILRKRFSERFLARCRNLVRRPGISVLKDAMTAVRSARVHAMHDPTEGGLATALRELSIASDCGILLLRDRVPVIRESARLLEFFGLDPLGAIASGALVIVTAPEDTDKVIRGLKRAGITAARIGTVTKRSEGLRMVENGRTTALKVFERDEITKIF